MSTALEREHSHRRYNPLSDEWVLVSPHRLKRPWQGKVEKVAPISVARHDPSNPLCPGVVRANGERTPDYTSTYMFPNDFPALEHSDTLRQCCPDFEQASASGNTPQSDVESKNAEESFFYRKEPAAGRCDVVCFHPHSDRPIPRMTLDEVRCVVDCWCDAYATRSREFEWVQIFENRGELMGCSNPHPHGQIWSCNFLPNHAERELRTQKEYYARTGRAMLLDYARNELLTRDREQERITAAASSSMQTGGSGTHCPTEESERHRVVLENASWLCVVPYWAVWPFETMLIAKRHVARLDELNDAERVDLASLLRSLLIKYDNLFECSFPYSGGWHAAPSGRFLHDADAGTSEAWQLHAHFYPPLLRSATVRKFLVGFEMLAEPQRDLTPERAARMLRQLDDQVHFADRTELANVN